MCQFYREDSRCSPWTGSIRGHHFLSPSPCLVSRPPGWPLFKFRPRWFIVSTSISASSVQHGNLSTAEREKEEEDEDEKTRLVSSSLEIDPMVRFEKLLVQQQKNQSHPNCLRAILSQRGSRGFSFDPCGQCYRLPRSLLATRNFLPPCAFPGRTVSRRR